MVDAIETRRLHILQRAQYITEHKMLTSFKPMTSIEQDTQ